MAVVSKKILCVLLVLLSIPVIFAQTGTELQLFAQEYHAGETVQAEILLGNALRPLATTQIALKDEQGSKISIAPFLSKREEKTYVLYFDLPATLAEGKYTLELQKIPYAANGTLQEETISKELMLNATTLPIVAISPAFILLKKNEKTFDITLTSKQGTATFFIDASSPTVQHAYSTPQILQAGTTRVLKFSLNAMGENAEQLFIDVDYETRTYHIPLYTEKSEEENQTISPQQPTPTEPFLEFLTAVKQVNRTIKPTQTLMGPFEFVNKQNLTIYNLTAQITGNLQEIISMNETTIAALEPGEKHAVYVWVNKEQQAALGVYRGEIMFTTGAASTGFPILITVAEESTVVEEEIFYPNQTGELQGEPLNLTLFNRSEPSITQAKKKSISAGAIIFIVLFIIVILFYIIFKNKKTVKKSSFEEYLERRN